MKLPRYVRYREKGGTYRFQRNVPLNLREKFGKKDHYSYLGKTYREMLIALPKAMTEFDALYLTDASEEKPDRDRLLALVRREFGADAADRLDRGEIDDNLEAALEDFGDRIDEPAIYHANLPVEVFSCADAVADYATYKDADDPANKKFKNSLTRVSEDFASVVGSYKFSELSIEDLTRADANAFRDAMLARVSANSAQRYLNIIKAVFNHTIQERALNCANIFANIKVKGAGHSSTDRLPLTRVEADTLADKPAKDDLKTIALLLRETGARVAEITGLEVADINFQESSINIRSNSIRGLKTKSSTREVPIIGKSCSFLLSIRQSKDYENAICTRYGKENGNTNVSNALSKHLRSITEDRKKTVHSLRHTKKDELRETACPSDIGKVILGHSSDDVSSKYGSGYSVKVFRSWLAKNW